MSEGLVKFQDSANIFIVKINSNFQAHAEVFHPGSQAFFYKEHDKVMVKDTGEVFTVHADLSSELESFIIVKEPVGKLLRPREVRPAGHTRQRLDLLAQISAPDLPPPLPEGCTSLPNVADFYRELRGE